VRQSSTALLALARANGRFWPTVALIVHRELAAWEAPAAAITDTELRFLALSKLRHERFNAEVAATLATLAPAAHRNAAAQAIVAFELLFDYLDGRTETTSVSDPLAASELLFRPFLNALRDPKLAAAQDGAGDPADGPYLRALSSRTQTLLNQLPNADVVRPFALHAARRCAEAQSRIHAVPMLGVAQLEGWATRRRASDGVDWRAYAAGCASSVLAVHALIALAADADTTAEDARRLDDAYLAIGALITVLDSIVDHTDDTARGEPGFVSFFENQLELPDVVGSLAREASSRAWKAPHAAHHAMTLAGVAAYYTTHPGARSPFARPSVRTVRGELSPMILPTLGIMLGWRAAKAVRAAGARHLKLRSATGARHPI
jgi:tetraprenyl-beta-curcumene synthase